jgi:hypothetical protein
LTQSRYCDFSGYAQNQRFCPKAARFRFSLKNYPFTGCYASFLPLKISQREAEGDLTQSRLGDFSGYAQNQRFCPKAARVRFSLKNYPLPGCFASFHPLKFSEREAEGDLTQSRYCDFSGYAQNQRFCPKAARVRLSLKNYTFLFQLELKGLEQCI